MVQGLKAALPQLLKAAAMEGTTEATQEWVEAWTAENATDVPTDQAELQSALINAFSLGALAGGPLGSFSGYKVARSQQERVEADKQIKKEEVEEEKLLQNWAKNQNFHELDDKGKVVRTMGLAQLKEFAAKNYPTLNLTTSTTEHQEAAVQDIIKAEREKEYNLECVNWV
jgi:hypothetical protein